MKSLAPFKFGVHVKVSDIYRSEDFYSSLGFSPVVAFGDDPFLSRFPTTIRRVKSGDRGVIYEVGASAQLEIADGHPAVRSEVFGEIIDSPKISAMVRVPTLVPLFSNPRINITYPVRYYYWSGGVIEAVFRDPDGFLLVFIADYSEEEFEKVSQFVAIETIARPEIS